MFEKSLYAEMVGDATLTGNLSTYEGRPAVFNELVPEGAEYPYVVFRIQGQAVGSPEVHEFTVFVDIYDDEKSRVTSRAICEAVEYLLDRSELVDDRYSLVRLFYVSAGPVYESDPRDSHINMLFNARAGRSKWAQQL